MSIIMGRGEEAKKAIENSGGSDGSKVEFIKLKPGESRKVRILSKFDYVAYKAHGHFKNGIFTQPCIKETGERCLLCEASAYKGELIGTLIDTVKNMKGEDVSEWASMYAKKRVLFAFVDLEEDEIRVFDATKNQADAIIPTIDEYGDDLDDMAFTFKRVGEKMDTSYSLNPIMPKKMKDIQEVFDKYDGETVTDEVFLDTLQARTTEEMAKDLKKAGFPMKEVFDIEVVVTNDDAPQPIDEDSSTDIKDEDLPF